ncbi:MAG: Aspartokinase [Alphaproteobacteria bacterium ADurb.BinA305]|nr:MAG: Aspartokinase [Alphaproteobacteria bacterium ADurb.BinA305]
MALIVQKYGGTSVGTPERMRSVARRVANFRAQGHRVVVVVSAMSGETNRLIALARAVAPSPRTRELDVVVSTGEQVSIGLLCMALDDLGVPARSYTGAQVRILTDSTHTRARILDIDAAPIRKDLDAGGVVVVAGFQGVDAHGNITTLGRGGSDTTAVALAAALEADECQIYTDARKLDAVRFEEMLELASLGSKVLQIRAVEFAAKYKVKLRVLSSFEEDPGEGTFITVEESSNMERPVISGIAFVRDEAKLTLTGVPDRPGIAYQILGPIADADIDVDMIIQNAPRDGSTDLSFTVARADLARAVKVLEGVQAHVGARSIESDDTMCKVSVVGVGMRSHPGVAAKMFRTLAEEGINIQMITTSEIRISVAIEEKHLERAVRALHKAYGLDVAAE